MEKPPSLMAPTPSQPFLANRDASWENFAYLQMCLPETELAWTLPLLGSWPGAGGSRADNRVS